MTKDNVDDKAFETLSLLYQENAKVAAIFWEWRNKIMTYFLTAISSLTVVASWLYQQYPGRYISAPLLLGSTLSFALYLLDKRNEEILKACYQIGGDVEYKLVTTIDAEENTDLPLLKKPGAIFTSIGKAHHNASLLRGRITYTQVLHIIFISIGVLLLALSIFNIICPIIKSS